VLYNCLSGVSLLVSSTTGSFCKRGGLFVITSDILGITSEQVMQLALLDRGVMVVVLVVLFAILFILNKLRESKNENSKEVGDQEIYS
jgi:Tfp pilus assembly protein PilZ